MPFLHMPVSFGMHCCDTTFPCVNTSLTAPNLPQPTCNPVIFPTISTTSTP